MFTELCSLGFTERNRNRTEIVKCSADTATAETFDVSPCCEHSFLIECSAPHSARIFFQFLKKEKKNQKPIVCSRTTVGPK